MKGKANREPDNNAVDKYKKPTKGAFKVLMESSQNLGSLTPSLKVIG